MATPEERIEITLAVKSVGEGQYEAHASSLNRVKQASEEAAAGGEKLAKSNERSAGSLMAVFGATNVLIGGLRRMKILTDEQSVGMMQLSGVLHTAIGLYRLLGTEALKTAASLWAKAVARIASAGPAAPLILAAVAGAVAGALALKAASGLAQGGIVTQPTFAMIGEAGPEAVIPLTDSRAEAALEQTGISRNNYVFNFATDAESAGSVIGRSLRDQLR